MAENRRNPKRLPFTKKTIDVKLEPSLSEKLEKKKAETDRLEEKQEIIRAQLLDKQEFAQTVKDAFYKKEKELLRSVQNIEDYMKEIQNLKLEAVNMYDKLCLENHELQAEYLRGYRENLHLVSKISKSEYRLKAFKTYKNYLEALVNELPQYESAKELVEYYLVLRIVRRDLIEANKKQEEEQENLLFESKRKEMEIRSHPLKILAKEDVLHNLAIAMKKLQTRNDVLEQHLEDVISETKREDLEWHDTERWIERLHKSVWNNIPLLTVERKDPNPVINRLQIIKECAVMGYEMLKRLKQNGS